MPKTNSYRGVGSVLNVARSALSTRRLPVVLKQLGRHLFRQSGSMDGDALRPDARL